MAAALAHLFHEPTRDPVTRHRRSTSHWLSDPSARQDCAAISSDILRKAGGCDTRCRDPDVAATQGLGALLTELHVVAVTTRKGAELLAALVEASMIAEDAAFRLND
jgi:hypothetical protein